MRSLVLLFCILAACRDAPPAYCRDRQDDADCDGVPDAQDRCAESPYDTFTDRLGCTENQAAGCAVSAIRPGDGDRADAEQFFRWSGDCDVYLLQMADDPDFPSGVTRTVVRTEGREVAATGTERYWRIVGAMNGGSAGYSTPARKIKW